MFYFYYLLAVLVHKDLLLDTDDICYLSCVLSGQQNKIRCPESNSSHEMMRPTERERSLKVKKECVYKKEAVYKRGGNKDGLQKIKICEKV